MSKHYKHIFEPFTPFLLVGVGIALFVAVLFMFFYIALWGVFIGGVLWLISFIKNYFFPNQVPKSHKGRIIDHDKYQ